jgi:hypothetical protein
MSPGTFAAFSKFHLNTSNSPNVKVVYFVGEHNFHVEWHLRFGVEIREKAWSTPRVTIHRCLEICHLGMQFVHKRLRKRSYALSKSCRGMLDLQLSYSNFCALQLNFLEFWSVKQGCVKWYSGAWRSLPLAARRRARPPGNRVVGSARTPRPHELRAACAGRLDGVSTAPLRHPARATRLRSPRRPPNPVAAVQARTSPSPLPMPRVMPPLEPLLCHS